MSQSPSLTSLADLRDYVHKLLCQYDDLVPGVFPMTERYLVRRGVACGLYFCLHGPRSTKFSAVWETEKNTILFYGPSGERYHRLELQPMSTVAAAA